MITFYKLCHNLDDTFDCYIGSTHNLIKRTSYHKCACVNNNNINYNKKLYTYIRNNGGWDNWHIVILEQHEEMIKYFRFEKEYQLIQQYDSKLNKNKPGELLRCGKNHKLYKCLYDDNYNVCGKCGSGYRGRSNKTHHEKTIKCINYGQ